MCLHGKQLRDNNFEDLYLDGYLAKMDDSKLDEELSWASTVFTFQFLELMLEEQEIGLDIWHTTCL